MYIDIIILIVLIILVVMFFKRFSSFVFLIAIIDMFLRIIDYIGNNIRLSDVSNIINKYFPDSVYAMIDRYSNGFVATILHWIYVVIMIIFLYYVIKIFIKKKKI